MLTLDQPFVSYAAIGLDCWGTPYDTLGFSLLLSLSLCTQNGDTLGFSLPQSLYLFMPH